MMFCTMMPSGGTAAPFDLHMHSACSDGTDAPALLVQKAYDCGLRLMALTDHDSMDGVSDAVRAGEALGVRVLPALEMDCEWPHELHILGLNVDPRNASLDAALKLARRRRETRNAEIFARLKQAGYDVIHAVKPSGEMVSRLHIANALVAAGFAADRRDAFMRYLKRGCVGYYASERFAPEEVISLIRHAGGQAVWAHPYHTTGEPQGLMRTLINMGLTGVEAYHPSASEGRSLSLVSFARQYGLLVTCGSDYHGQNRPESALGQTWRDCPVLSDTYGFFMRA